MAKLTADTLFGSYEGSLKPKLNDWTGTPGGPECYKLHRRYKAWSTTNQEVLYQQHCWDYCM